MRKILPLLCAAVLSLPAFAQQSRHFTFHYAFTVRNIEPGQKLELWIPQAHSDQFQDVKVLSINSDLPLKRTREPRFGNVMYHAVVAHAPKPEYNVDVVYDVVRHERIGLPHEGLQPTLVKVSAQQASGYLAPDKLVPVTGKLADIAAAQVQGKTTNMDRARALYDYVFSTMRYDKTGTGWGRGDAEWACDSKRGNCTDFHSVFISMARSQHIPARFEIGLPLPQGKHSGEIAGYHCWAEFYDAQYGWVPVDISEAWKDQSKKDYFFGDHDVNRIQLSMGRDLVLSPKQAGEPLNYFVYPYVEVGGKKWENIANHFSFNDQDVSERASN
jgi:hypothetical protein